MKTTANKKRRKQRAVRTLTISEHIRLNRWSRTSVPYIRLCGNWLQELGFSPQQKIQVTAMDNMLLIEAVPHSGTVRKEVERISYPSPRIVL